MKQVSIQELKQRLSAIVAWAEEGESILITRHRRPVARMTSAEHAQLHLGVRHGKGSLSRILRNATEGRYLDVLSEDRRGEEGDG